MNERIADLQLSDRMILPPARIFQTCLHSFQSNKIMLRVKSYKFNFNTVKEFTPISFPADIVRATERLQFKCSD